MKHLIVFAYCSLPLLGFAQDIPYSNNEVFNLPIVVVDSLPKGNKPLTNETPRDYETSDYLGPACCCCYASIPYVNPFDIWGRYSFRFTPQQFWFYLPLQEQR